MFEKEAEEYATENWEYYEEGKNDSKELKQAYQQGAEFGYNKCKEELNQNGLALQSDMDKTIEQNIALKKELNNMLVSKNQQLIKAKEIIKDYLTIVKGSHTTVCGVPEENSTIYVLKLNKEAEQFLRGNE